MEEGGKDWQVPANWKEVARTGKCPKDRRG